MMGAGGALMLWELACIRTGCGILINPAYGDPYFPVPRAQAMADRQSNPASWRYYRLLGDINLLGSVFPYDGRGVTIWLDGPRHNCNTELAA